MLARWEVASFRSSFRSSTSHFRLRGGEVKVQRSVKSTKVKGKYKGQGKRTEVRVHIDSRCGCGRVLWLFPRVELRAPSAGIIALLRQHVLPQLPADGGIQARVLRIGAQGCAGGDEQLHGLVKPARVAVAMEKQASNICQVLNEKICKISSQDDTKITLKFLRWKSKHPN